MGTMRLVVDEGRGQPAEVPIESLPELLADRNKRLWLDISDPGSEDVKLLRRVFGFHELTLEEVTRPHERPRCDAHEGYYFIVVYAVECSENEFRPRELNLFWGANYLVRPSVSTQRVEIRLPGRSRVSRMHGRVGFHPLASASLALSRDSGVLSGSLIHL